ncbi:MAG: AbgT family transporter, partial [Planctomycetaceae bacterium]
MVNPLCNWFFTGCSSVLIIAIGWVITDFVIEPRLKNSVVDGDPDQMPKLPELSDRDRRGMALAGLSVLICVAVLAVWSLWPGSALQAKPPEGQTWALYQRLTSLNKAAPAKLMNSIVPLIFIFFLIPGLVHG